jgi:protein-S-isoprenylcysteine O-methyltransferase Ste14
MTRVGIGIKLLAAIAVTLLVTGIVTYLLAGIFRVSFADATALRTAALVLMAIGLTIQLSSSPVPSSAVRNKELVTTGIFAYVRHPMYSSWILFITPGIALFFGSWLMLVASLVGYLSFKHLIKEEDEYLTGIFGQEYLDYRSRVGEIFPKRG